MSAVGQILLTTLGLATPLLFGALGETIVQKSGVVNVGLEGIMLTGAFAATFSTLHSANPYLGLVGSMLAGMALALLFAAFALGMGANQVVVGVVVNLFALGLTGTGYRRLTAGTGSGFLTTKALPALTGNLTLLTFVALALVPVCAFWLGRTRPGLELRACGEAPAAAEASGVPVLRFRLLALLFGGAMAGLGGAFLSIGFLNTFNENMTAGRGFIALAIVTAGRWNVWGCLIAALIFGLASALQFHWQALGLALPYQLFLALPYLATLAILMIGGRRSAAPAALGRPYRRA